MKKKTQNPNQNFIYTSNVAALLVDKQLDMKYVNTSICKSMMIIVKSLWRGFRGTVGNVLDCYILVS